MTRYSSLIGKRVEARYRAGGVHLSVSGTLVSDNGRAVSVEEVLSTDGRGKIVRVEIPYDCVIRISPDGGSVRSCSPEFPNPK